MSTASPAAAAAANAAPRADVLRVFFWNVLGALIGYLAVWLLAGLPVAEMRGHDFSRTYAAPAVAFRPRIKAVAAGAVLLAAYCYALCFK